MTQSTRSTGLSRRKFLKGTAGAAGAAAVVSTFGIGTADSVALEIRWPSGHTDRIDEVRAGGLLVIEEGRGATVERR